jgi:hypothetical protein
MMKALCKIQKLAPFNAARLEHMAYRDWTSRGKLALPLYEGLQGLIADSETPWQQNVQG